MPRSKKKKAEMAWPEGNIMQISDDSGLVRLKYLSFLGCDMIL
jgi:hypothetical protein